MTDICVGKTAIIGSDNGLSPGRRQAIIWTNAGILLIGTLGTNIRESLIECYLFSFKKMHMKMSSGKWRPSCLGLNVLNGRLMVRDIVAWNARFATVKISVYTRFIATPSDKQGYNFGLFNGSDYVSIIQVVLLVCSSQTITYQTWLCTKRDWSNWQLHPIISSHGGRPYMKM